MKTERKPGACARCNRMLSDPTSIATGLGPICRTKATANDSGALLEDQPVLNGVGGLREVGLICQRRADGRLACNVPHIIRYHSRTGFSCGYGGSGPADLALNVLHLLLPSRTLHDYGDGRTMKSGSIIDGTGVSTEAEQLHQEFKDEFISTMPKDGGFVPIERIMEWITRRLIKEAA